MANLLSRGIKLALTSVLMTGAHQATADDSELITKDPQTYTIQKSIEWKSGGHIKDIYEPFDPSTMIYRPGITKRNFDVNGSISSYFYYRLANSANMSVTSLPYLLALQDVYNGATEIDLTILGEAKKGSGMVIGGRVMSANYLPVDKIDLSLAKSSSDSSLEHLIKNIRTTNSPTRKIYGAVLLGLRYSHTGKHGEEIAEALNEIYETSSPTRKALNISARLFNFISPSFNEIRASAVFAMHLLKYTQDFESNDLADTLEKAKHDKDEMVRVFAQETERILSGRPAVTPQVSTSPLDSLIKQCMRGLNSRE